MGTVYPSTILVETEHRYRIESRFTIRGYRNRFRYRLGLSVPLYKNSDGNIPFMLNIGNEIFLSNLEPYFERNRISSFLVYKIANTSFQLGYMHQYDYKLTSQTAHDFIIAGIALELNRKTNKGNIIYINDD